MARRRFQSGCLFKRGKRRKVWVARWREDVLLDGGERRTDCERSCRHGGATCPPRPRRRGGWRNYSGRSTRVRHGRGRYCVRDIRRNAVADAGLSDAQALDTTRVQERPPESSAALLAGLAAARHQPPGHPAVGRRQVPAATGLADGPQCLGAAVGHSRNGGRIRLPFHKSGAGREVPAEGSEGGARYHRRRRPS